MKSCAYDRWKSVFGGSTEILNRTVLLNEEPYKVIGVMGPDL